MDLNRQPSMALSLGFLTYKTRVVGEVLKSAGGES